MLLFWQTYFLDSEMLGHQENMTNVIYFLLIYDSLQVYNNQKQNQYGRLYLASLKTAILKLLRRLWYMYMYFHFPFDQLIYQIKI